VGKSEIAFAPKGDTPVQAETDVKAEEVPVEDDEGEAIYGMCKVCRYRKGTK
jgi:hypothetical protein